MVEQNNKLRILAIHGYRQSGSIFKSKLGSLRKSFKQKIDFVFAEAPHQVPPLQTDSNEEETTGDTRGWWFNTADHTFIATEPSNLSVGFNDSVKVIENIFKDQGPFDGILGFSQGASFVSILCSMQQKKLADPLIKFDFAIMISGFKSLCEPHAVFYDEKFNLPTLHVYGETDRIIPTEMAKSLSDLFTNKKVVIHEGGHFVAGKKHIYNDFFNEMYVTKNNSKV
ncbi:esterase OVCA2 [Microplitis mediator]|uniref:esterase OVCA2 n=1 Tax=Microplitis mediator TaxID=375433 RepID=UPI0025579AB8|nr:esterase OVCA2 [Microplitis mediator]XP_057325572.1 esterase OVCA2 [Microplitis mediator]